MLGWLLWMRAWSILLIVIIVYMRLGGDSIATPEWWRPADLASYVSFVIKYFPIYQTMGPAHQGNICRPKRTSQSQTN